LKNTLADTVKRLFSRIEMSGYEEDKDEGGH
jgi:hypothetical protein